MIGIKLEKFLERQKARMIEMDKLEGYNTDINSPKYIDEKTGRPVSGMEVLYENTLGWLKSGSAWHSLGNEYQLLENMLTEDTLSTAAPTFTTQMLPLVRRMFHGLVAQDLVSIQPISSPSAYVYWLNKLYTDNTAEVDPGDRLDLKTPKEYVSSSEQGTIREIQMQLQRKLVETQTDKLKADWTLEAEQDWRRIIMQRLQNHTLKVTTNLQ